MTDLEQIAYGIQVLDRLYSELVKVRNQNAQLVECIDVLERQIEDSRAVSRGLLNEIEHSNDETWRQAALHAQAKREAAESQVAQLIEAGDAMVSYVTWSLRQPGTDIEMTNSRLAAWQQAKEQP